MYDPWTWIKVGMQVGGRVQGEMEKGGVGNMDNCNSTINKIYFKKEKKISNEYEVSNRLIIRLNIAEE